MYRSHWGLREIPFRSGVDSRFLYESASYEEALARLQNLVEDHHRLGLLVGLNGIGKSLLLEMLDRQLRRNGTQVVHLSLLGIDTHELLWCIAADLGMNPDRRANEAILWRMINDGLETNKLHDQDTVFLLDDADEASPLVLDSVARLVDCVRSADARITFICTAALDNLHNMPMRLMSQLELRVDLNVWDETDTANYLLNSLRQAGGRDIAFSNDAIRRLHQLCEGIPRRITQLANRALLTGACLGLKRIEAQTIESAWGELRLANVA